MNLISPVVAAFTTLLVGFVWYHPKVFVTVWMKETGLTQEELQKGICSKSSGGHLFFLFLFLL